MAVIKIENFGGEMPSVSARALPDAAAQENSNLFAGTAEFRPLKSDVSVGTSVAATKSLFRIDPSQPWITSTQARSYVRGQINGDVNKRTYYSIDSGTAQPPRAMDITGADRQLGVPLPAKPVVTVTAVDEVTWEEADTFCYGEGARSIRAAIAAHRMPSGASQHFQGTTILAGPYGNYGLLFPSNAAVPAALQAQPWCLVAEITTARATELGLEPSPLGAVESAGKLYIPLPCMAYKFQLNTATVSPALAALLGPDGTTPLLNTNMIETITNAADVILSVADYAQSERNELDALAREFAQVLASASTVPPGGTAPGSRPTAPTKPTVGQYSLEGYGAEGGNYVRHPDWVVYDAALAAYELAMQTYSEAVVAQEAVKAGVSERLISMQQRGASLIRAIEAKGLDRWERISRENSEIQSLVTTMGGVTALVPYAVRREVETRFYVVTFVSDWGEESAPSPVSDLVELDQNDTLALGLPAVGAGGSYASRAITHWRIYRSNVGSASAAFQFEVELPIATTSYTGNVAASALGEVLPTTTWLEPPADLRGLVGMPNGIMAGFTGNTVAFCEPYVPYAWPVEYQVTTEHPIVGMGVFGQTLFVGTTGNPYFISGADSASMSAVKMESNQSCASARSIAAVQGGVLYASPDGLCVADPTGVKVVSQGLFTREDWQALTPSSMFAMEHEGVYYLFYNNGTKGCLAFDLATKKLGRVALQADASYTELVSDTLFVASGTSILAVFGGETRRTARWKSKRMTMPAQASMAWLKVYGDQTPAAPVTLRLYGDGTLVHTATVTNINPQRLPSGRWLEFEVDVESQSRVTRVVVAGSTQELQAV
ncbi:hypothetical protein C380_10845 [Acidovorax sp. KKS102]|uniref:hypothetical protein n=1 Tax=Acidovorax sp. KKS102 TaxID=358220 RepID=UPI00028B8FAF|nr:hypothetical protein [Acidovorax sp. KKS102]AFU45870.1 hypothetical protein C380_10845 [Acidovorax sp. KKS102]